MPRAAPAVRRVAKSPDKSPSSVAKTSWNPNGNLHTSAVLVLVVELSNISVSELENTIWSRISMNCAGNSVAKSRNNNTRLESCSRKGHWNPVLYTAILVPKNRAWMNTHTNTKAVRRIVARIRAILVVHTKNSSTSDIRWNCHTNSSASVSPV